MGHTEWAGCISFAAGAAADGADAEKSVICARFCRPAGHIVYPICRRQRYMEEAFEQSPPSARSSTTSVVVLLSGAALIFSYLVSYALTNALVAANLMQRWTPENDPRPRRMLIGFA